MIFKVFFVCGKQWNVEFFLNSLSKFKYICGAVNVRPQV